MVRLLTNNIRVFMTSTKNSERNVSITSFIVDS